MYWFCLCVLVYAGVYVRMLRLNLQESLVVCLLAEVQLGFISFKLWCGWHMLGMDVLLKLNLQVCATVCLLAC
jgi:hypothetical protein